MPRTITAVSTPAHFLEYSFPAMGHHITFWFRGNAEIDYALKSSLAEEAVSRARQMIAEVCISGELHYEDDRASFSGWWSIPR